MIVVVGRVATDAEHRAELIQVGQTVARASREEEGCHGYALYADTEDEHRFVFVEEWESQEALDTHFQTEHIATFMAAIQPLLVEAPDLKFHTVASTVDFADRG